ncbi:response regulator transcription factor [Sulfitobacter pseudonitzschiae]|uniref:Response regulator transcription factor n=1 Tax=Pseudosulfitobacter pseudonitzschiae TaxID=1402135 RepID=A0A9Q2RUW5_9RHOB|nr:response regulator transcription factor [Pseudosulfitobacter pseudonitzschiae]MBM2291551.1 response regulator transcription factor [Pseudosulfitobacter pseudonitzschiae]MBM2296469.1 response regulator transcription factor [Pseudosulfitobacter pseudonitzschiae]MBM2301382.1 response regulator transcription factor [Pseudosulfitobacter pseudonitzschiae]MBM2311166.1 response regulator transcription factor [Pseudosulfitobacter pseudonitzschiae]MBM2316079.1 response regulator transcription factor 
MTRANRQPTIAIVDDDAQVRQTLSALLEQSGYHAIACPDSAAFHALGDPPAIDLALIDLRLRGESGLMLAIQIREKYNLPIVMLTGVGDEIDKIIGLETGADDYLIKPFNPRELVARIRAVLRRYGHGAVTPAATGHEIGFGNKRVDLQKRELQDAAGNEIPLTNAEYRLLDYFVRNPGRIIPRPELLDELGSDSERYLDRTIDVLILRLRRKIEPIPSKPVHLQTRRAQGYIFVLDGRGA